MITYNINNSNKKNTNNNSFYFPNTKSTNHSKTLDDLIFDDLMDKNKWLSDYFYHEPKKEDPIKFTIKYAEPDEDYFPTYINWLTNYKTNGLSKYIILDKYYDLGNGNMFALSTNYMYINGKFYWFDDLKDKDFIKIFTPKEKKTIATIFTDTLKITIKA